MASTANGERDSKEPLLLEQLDDDDDDVDGVYICMCVLALSIFIKDKVQLMDDTSNVHMPVV